MKRPLVQFVLFIQFWTGNPTLECKTLWSPRYASKIFLFCDIMTVGIFLNLWFRHYVKTPIFLLCDESLMKSFSFKVNYYIWYSVRRFYYLCLETKIMFFYKQWIQLKKMILFLIYYSFTFYLLVEFIMIKSFLIKFLLNSCISSNKVYAWINFQRFEIL